MIKIHLKVANKLSKAVQADFKSLESIIDKLEHSLADKIDDYGNDLFDKVENLSNFLSQIHSFKGIMKDFEKQQSLF